MVGGSRSSGRQDAESRVGVKTERILSDPICSESVRSEDMVRVFLDVRLDADADADSYMRMRMRIWYR